MSTEWPNDELHFTLGSARSHQNDAQCAYTSQWEPFKTTLGNGGAQMEPDAGGQDRSLDEPYHFFGSDLGATASSTRVGNEISSFSRAVRSPSLLYEAFENFSSDPYLDNYGESLRNAGLAHVPDLPTIYQSHQTDLKPGWMPSFDGYLRSNSPPRVPPWTWDNKSVPLDYIAPEYLINTHHTSDLKNFDVTKPPLFLQTLVAPQPASLHTHAPAHSQNRLTCPHGCRGTFGRTGDYRRHLVKHQTPRFKCIFSDCDRAFHRADKLKSHVSKGHKSSILSTRPGDAPSTIPTTSTASQQSLHTCTQCDKAFKLRADLSRHEATVHKDPEANLIPCPNPGCSSTFVRRDHLSRHRRQCQRKVAPDKAPQPVAIRPLPEGSGLLNQMSDTGSYTTM